MFQWVSAVVSESMCLYTIWTFVHWQKTSSILKAVTEAGLATSEFPPLIRLCLCFWSNRFWSDRVCALDTTVFLLSNRPPNLTLDQLAGYWRMNPWPSLAKVGFSKFPCCIWKCFGFLPSWHWICDRTFTLILVSRFLSGEKESSKYCDKQKRSEEYERFHDRLDMCMFSFLFFSSFLLLCDVIITAILPRLLKQQNFKSLASTRSKCCFIHTETPILQYPSIPRPSRLTRSFFLLMKHN